MEQIMTIDNDELILCNDYYAICIVWNNDNSNLYTLNFYQSKSDYEEFIEYVERMNDLYFLGINYKPIWKNKD